MNNKDLTDLISLYEKDLPDNLLEIENYGLENNIPIIRRGSFNALEFFLKDTYGNSILEIGTAIGFSALLIMEFLKDRDISLTTIEINEESFNKALENFKKNGFKINEIKSEILSIEINEYNKKDFSKDYKRAIYLEKNNKVIKIILGDGSHIIKALNEKYNIIFLDSSKGQYKFLIGRLIELLDSKGKIIIDNILHKGDILKPRYEVRKRDRTIYLRLRELIFKLCKRKDINTLFLEEGDGMCIISKKEGKSF